MFFCEPCREYNNWPGVVPFSSGICEVCEKGPRRCYDVSSSLLPTPAREPLPDFDTEPANDSNA